MFNKLIFILSFFQKSRIHFLIFSLIAVSLLEVIGVGIIIPFISILISGEFFSDLNLYFLNEFLKDKSQNEIILLITVFIVLFSALYTQQMITATISLRNMIYWIMLIAVILLLSFVGRGSKDE